MTFLDLFAGIGGFRRGMELAGHKCIGFCEWDKFARASYISMHCITEKQREYLSTLNLKQRQKEILKDEYLNGEWGAVGIRTVTGENIPRADCWCFGAPCQDFSIVGKRAGLNGDRSSLVREVFRILDEIREEDRPEWLIYENVKGMLSSNRGFDFLSILIEMGERGYDIEWQLLNSKDFGVPQNRERVFTIGHLRNRGGQKIFPISGTNGHDSFWGDPGMTLIDKNKYGKVRTVANTITAREDRGVSNQKRTGTAIIVNEPDNKSVATVWYEPYRKYVSMRKLTPKECFRLQGWADDYFEKAVFVNSDSQLYKQAGNGVTENVVQAIGELIEK